MTHESYCNGEAGKAANAASNPANMLSLQSGEEELAEHEKPRSEQKSLVEAHKEKMEKEKLKKKRKADGQVAVDEDDDEIARAKRVKEAIKRQKQSDKAAEELLAQDERSRK